MPFSDRTTPALAITTLIAAVTLAISTGKAHANLDLFSAIAEVDSTHPLANAKREELRAAESGLSAAKQQRLPTLSVQTSRPVTTGSQNIYTTRVQQPLFAGGRIDAGIERSEAQIAEAQANLTAARRDLMVRTASAFIEVIKGKARLQIANRSVDEHQRLLESIDRRVGSEISPESDLMLTRSRLSQSVTERSQVALALQRAEDALAELLNRKPPELIEPSLRPPAPFAGLQAALDAGEIFAPEIKRASAQESIALGDLDIQKAAAFPTIYARHDQNSGDLSTTYARSQTYLGVEFIPGAGLSVASQIQAAQNRRQAAIEARRAAEKDVRDRIRSLWAESASLKRQLESAQNYVRSAQVVSDSFARQFTIGRKTWLEVLNAIRESALAELSLADIFWSSRLTDLRLEIETGKLTLDTMRPVSEPEVRPVTKRSAPKEEAQPAAARPAPEPKAQQSTTTAPAIKDEAKPVNTRPTSDLEAQTTKPALRPTLQAPIQPIPARSAPEVLVKPAAAPILPTPQTPVQPTPIRSTSELLLPQVEKPVLPASRVSMQPAPMPQVLLRPTTPVAPTSDVLVNPIPSDTSVQPIAPGGGAR